MVKCTSYRPRKSQTRGLTGSEMVSEGSACLDDVNALNNQTETCLRALATSSSARIQHLSFINKRPWHPRLTKPNYSYNATYSTKKHSLTAHSLGNFCQSCMKKCQTIRSSPDKGAKNPRIWTVTKVKRSPATVRFLPFSGVVEGNSQEASCLPLSMALSLNSAPIRIKTMSQDKRSARSSKSGRRPTQWRFI